MVLGALVWLGAAFGVEADGTDVDGVGDGATGAGVALDTQAARDTSIRTTAKTIIPLFNFNTTLFLLLSTERLLFTFYIESIDFAENRNQDILIHIQHCGPPDDHSYC